GALLIVAPNERKVRIEVGYGLEGTLTDAISKLIIENSILPRFKAGDFAGGITRGVDDIIQVLSGDAEDWKTRAKQRPDSQPVVLNIVIFMLGWIVLIMIIRRVMQLGGPGGLAAGRSADHGGSIFFPAPMPWSSGSSDSPWSGSSGGFSD